MDSSNDLDHDNISTEMLVVYIPSTWNIISSYDVVFDESFSSALAYTSQPYSE